mmetsp:Transcript_22840/g.77809  ORF Transcript_22840/g.77809 Transcript_22840/m.77809 type:complete len:429 (+) Transcript_22840:97-1383(+)
MSATTCDVDFNTMALRAAGLGQAVARRLAKPPTLARFAALRYRRRDAFGRAVDSGTGACMYRKRAGSWAKGFFTWSPCHGYSPFMGMEKARPRQVPMCPRSVPLAFVAVHKAATTSVINWVSSMEGASMEAVRIIGDLTDCICAGGVETAFNEDSGNASVAHSTALELVRPLLHYLDHSSSPLDQDAVRAFMPLLGSCHDAWLPAMYCPSCCTPVTHPRRMHLAFVRNPYRRFASAYTWLRGDPGRFQGFVEAFYEIWSRSPGLIEDPDTIPDKHLPFPWDWGVGFGPGRSWLRAVEVFHFRSAYLELLEGFETISPFWRNQSWPEKRSLGLRINALHLEAFDVEWPEIRDSLCHDFGHCGPLPALEVLNSRGNSEWREIWGGQTARMIRDMLDADFIAFGYGDDPEEASPLRPEIMKLDLLSSPPGS